MRYLDWVEKKREEGRRCGDLVGGGDEDIHLGLQNDMLQVGGLEVVKHGD